MPGSGKTRQIRRSGQSSQEPSSEQERSLKGKDLDGEMAKAQAMFTNDHYYQSMYRRNVVCCFFCFKESKCSPYPEHIGCCTNVPCEGIICNQ